MKRTDLLLLCMHIRLDVLLDDTVYCPQCRKMMEVVGEMQDWRLKCEDCRFARKFGYGKTRCFTSAAKHMALKRHTVITWMSGNWEATVEYHRPAIEPLFGDDS